MALLLLIKVMVVVVEEVVPVVNLPDLDHRDLLLMVHPVVQEELSHNSLDLEYIL